MSVVFTIEEATAYISFKDVYLTRSTQLVDTPLGWVVTRNENNTPIHLP